MRGRYLIRRVIAIVPTIFAIALIAFVVIRLLPGDPAVLMAGEFATPQEIVALRRQYGLDRPIYAQYLIFLGQVARGDLGRSTRSTFPVRDELGPRFLATLQLATAAIVIALGIGLGAGIMAGVRPHSRFDNLMMLIALLGVSTPIFWSGLLLLVIFSVKLNWLPPGGRGGLAHLVLPALTLGAYAAGVVARQTRASMLEVINQGYVVTAQAKGLSQLAVVMRHALPNALIPIVTLLGLQFGYLLGGSLLAETVFSWPGMGKYLIDAILARDYPVVQGAILVFGLAFALTNLVVDLLYGFLDPRISYS